MAIHNSITQGSLTLGEKAVIDKYGLEVELDGGLYIITDPITDTTSHGAKLDKVLQKAIKIRQDYDKKLEVETSPVLEPTATSTPHMPAPTKRTKSKKIKTEPVVEETVLVTIAGLTNGELPLAIVDDSVDEKGGNTNVEDAQGTVEAEIQDKPTTTPPEPESATTIEPEAPPITPERKTRTKKVKPPRQEGKYMRSIRLIAANPGITDVELGRHIGSSRHYAAYLMQIYHGVVKVLTEEGKIK